MPPSDIHHDTNFGADGSMVIDHTRILASHEQRLCSLEAEARRTDEKMESRFSDLGNNVKNLEERMNDKIDAKFDDFGKRLDAKFQTITDKIDKNSDKTGTQWMTLVQIAATIIGSLLVSLVVALIVYKVIL